MTGVFGRLADRFAGDPMPSPAAMAVALTSSLPSERRWETARHLEVLDSALVDAVAGRTPRLVVSMPPRHGKSELAARWLPLWVLSRWPDRRVVIASHSGTLATEHGRRVRDLVAEHGPALGLEVAKTSSAADRWDVQGRAGGLYAVGIGGSLTGRGADVLLVDDPVASAEDAESVLMRDRAWSWWQSVALTRLEPGASVILVQTRWHPDDLAGRVLAEEPDVWRSLSLPALAEVDDPLGRLPGEALWPARYDVEVLEARRRAVGPRAWAALFQQRPVPLEGLLFHRASVEANRIGPGDVPELQTVGEFVDPSFSDSPDADETGRIVMGRDADGICYVLADLSERRPFDRMPIGDSQASHGITAVYVEQNLLGRRVVVALAGSVPDGVRVVPIVAKGSKAMRAEVASTLVDNGRVKFVGLFPELEGQLLSWRPEDGNSPDRLDAFVHGVRVLLLEWRAQRGARSRYRERTVPRRMPGDAVGGPASAEEASRRWRG